MLGKIIERFSDNDKGRVGPTNVNYIFPTCHIGKGHCVTALFQLATLNISWSTKAYLRLYIPWTQNLRLNGATVLRSNGQGRDENATECSAIIVYRDGSGVASYGAWGP